MDVGTNLYLKYLGGDKNALQQLVEMYSDGLVRFAYCFVADSAAAEDIMEDTFAAAVSRRRFFPKNATFKTYLYKIARNKSIDYLRFNKRFVPFEDVENVLADGFSVCENLEQQERNQTLYKCLQQLPKQYRDVLQLTYLEQFDIKQVCKVLGKNTKQVYNLLARAKAEMKQLLEKEGLE